MSRSDELFSDSVRALDVALELADLRRNGTTLGEEFPESRALLVDTQNRLIEYATAAYYHGDEE